MSSLVEQGEKPYEGRVGVFFGGSGGTGLVAAVEYQKLGGTVYIGASSEATFSRAKANVRLLKGDRESVRSVIGNVTDRNLLFTNIMEIVERQKQEGKPVTDVFAFQAAGIPFAMEMDQEFLGPMNKIVAENPPNKDELLEVKKAELRRRYAIWLPESRDDAIAVNFQSKIDVINGFIEAYRGDQPLTFIDFNSRFGKEGKGPGFYGNVLTKHEFSLWMGENADRLAGQGIDAAEFTSDVVEDTDVGKTILNKIVPLLKPELGAMMIRTKVRRIHVFGGMREFLEMTREERAYDGRPFERYVLGDNGEVIISAEVPERLKMDMEDFDL